MRKGGYHGNGKSKIQSGNERTDGNLKELITIISRTLRDGYARYS